MKKEKKIIKTDGLIDISDSDLYDLFCQKGIAQACLELHDTSRNKYIDGFFSVHMLEAEVYNGGFDQFFENGGGDLHFENALFTLENIGALKFKTLLEEAIKIDLADNCEQITISNSKYETLDDAFYHANTGNSEFTRLNLLQIKFIRDNINLFS